MEFEYGSTVHRTLEYQLNSKEEKKMDTKVRCIKDVYSYTQGLSIFRGEICEVGQGFHGGKIYHNNKWVCDLGSLYCNEHFEIIEEEKKMGEMGKSIWFDSMYISGQLVGNKQGMFDRIENIFFNEEKRTVVIKWKDDTTTKSTCNESDYFDPFVGFCIAYTSKEFNSKLKLKAKIMRMFEKSKKRGK